MDGNHRETLPCGRRGQVPMAIRRYLTLLNVYMEFERHLATKSCYACLAWRERLSIRDVRGPDRVPSYAVTCSYKVPWHTQARVSSVRSGFSLCRRAFSGIPLESRGVFCRFFGERPCIIICLSFIETAWVPRLSAWLQIAIMHKEEQRI